MSELIVEGELPKQNDWFGKYLDEDGIVADIVARVKADAEGLKRWLDPASWTIPSSWTRRPIPFSRQVEKKDPEHAGCLVFAGMSIRNFYGLWHASNPHTAFDGDHDDLIVENGVITDPRHPDNMSHRIIERVKQQLADDVAELA